MKSRPKPLRWLKWSLTAGLVLGATGIAARWWWFTGPYQPVKPLPAGSAVIDAHCHTAGIGAGDSGCFISPAMENNWRFGIYLKSFGVTREDLTIQGDSLVIRRMAEQVSQSRRVRAAVVLALDGVLDEHGELDRKRTEVYVPNEFVARETARYTNLLFGASIHPRRPDALQRLDWAAANGAVLVKWIPPIMEIDPADERLTPFYQRMAQLKLPLLTHTGRERSFTTADDTLSDPARLELPLRLGVTVIAAHAAANGESEGQPAIERLFAMMRRHPNLYADISALTQVNKLGMLQTALRDRQLQSRLLYGSDFPLINTALVSPWYFPLNLTVEQMSELSAVENPWDRDVALKQALGVPAEVFHRTETLLPREIMAAKEIPQLTPARSTTASWRR